MLNVGGVEKYEVLRKPSLPPTYSFGFKCVITINSTSVF
jgi:hypothetical protein